MLDTTTIRETVSRGEEAKGARYAEVARYAREHAPSAREAMLLLRGIGLTAVGLIYAFSRNRQRWLNDTSNINRRWDRPDRLADTRQEEERGPRRPGFEDPSDSRSEGAGYGV
jgi:hypothetical protein